MATGKRKRAPAATSSRKRTKAGTHPHGQVDSEKEYKLKSIVDETNTEYLISWENDETTGEAFDDTWEPKANANQWAIDDWERQKAEKKRLERQTGDRAVRSSSRSANSTPARATSKKLTPPKPLRGRPRKIVESSPPHPSSDREEANGRHAQAPPEDLLEISESQQSEPGIQEQELPDSSAASPLFVTDYGSLDTADRVAVNIAPSLPPSSYHRGEYEQFTSSQLPSCEAPAPSQPEPSQYVPDPVDTTGTTEDTAEVSAVQTTPSQPTRSAPVNFETTSRSIADSQSLPGSSSYIPSAQNSNSHSEPTTESIDTSSARASQVQQHGNEHSASPAPGGEGQLEAFSAEHVEELHETTNPQLEQSEQFPRPEEGPDLSLQQGGQSIDQTDLHPSSEVFQPKNSITGTRLATNSLFASEDETSEFVRGASPAVSGQVRSPQASAGALAGEDEAVVSNEEFDCGSIGYHPHLASSSAQAPTSAQPQTIPGAISTGSPSGNQVNPTAAPRELASLTLSGIPDYQSTQRNDESVTETSSHSVQQDETELGPRQIGANHVDLTSTTQEPQTSILPFTPTPEVRNAVSVAQSYPRRQPASSDFLFSFQTQISRPNSANAALHHSQSHAAFPQTRILLGSRTTHPVENTTRLGAQSSPIQQLSSPPNPPSQSLATNLLGESAPPALEAFSTPLLSPPIAEIMDKSQKKPSASEIFDAKLKAIREPLLRDLASRNAEIPKSTPGNEAAATSQTESQPSAVTAPPRVNVEASETPSAIVARRLASPLLLAQDGGRSPSTVPHLEPLPVITQEEMNTSARYETLFPQAPEHRNASQPNGSLTSLGTPSRSGNGDAENADLYTIPISMVGSQMDHYRTTADFYREPVQRFLKDSNTNADIVDELKEFVERMRSITMHLDLDNAETFTQFDVEPADQADWDVKCSAKFRFLKDVFYAIRDKDVTIAIVNRPGRVLDMLEILLQGKKIPFHRLGTSPSTSFERDGGARALLLDTSLDASKAENADLVIGMENLVRHDTPLIRALRRKGDRWAPFVSLVVPRTVEHIERCLSPDLSDHEVARALVRGIYKYKSVAGSLEVGQQAPKEAAVVLAQYLTGTDDNDTWSVAPLTLLQDLDSRGESDVDAGIHTTSLTSTKRSRQLDDGVINAAESNKRARINAQDTSGEVDLTHISDSIDNSTQSKDIGGKKSSEQRATEERLRMLLVNAQNREDELVQNLADLQYRHEEQRAKLLEVTRERDEAIHTAQNAVTRLSENSNSMSTLRARRSQLEQELKEAEDRLLDHSIPERAEFEALRAAAAQAKVDKEKAETKLQRTENDLTYVRGLYQGSSSRAQELMTHNTDLENQVAVLKNKATGEHVKLRQMYLDDVAENLRKENKKLKMLAKDRESAIKARDDEIAKMKEASRGRIGTRNTSIPRTPRVGSPMKGRVGSRQTSPAAGDLRERNTMLHPLRNAQGQ